MQRRLQTESVPDFIFGEEWRIAVGYKYYLVSNLGRVYSLYQSKVLKYNIVNDYTEVKLKTDSGGFKHVKVHRLVAEMFLDKPEHKPQVHHIDCNSKNNAAVNLMFVTPEEHKEIHRRLREQQKGGETNEQSEIN